MIHLGQSRVLMRPKLTQRWLLLLLLLQCTLLNLALEMAQAVCLPESGCEVAYAYYKAQANETLDSIGAKFQVTSQEILAANPAISNHTTLFTNQPLYIPFTCECLQNQLLHTFKYQVQRADTMEFIAGTVFEDLTQTSWIGSWNSVPDTNFILTGDNFSIPVKCFCGDPNVSPSYAVFLTYVIAAGAEGNLTALASDFNASEALLMAYNPSVNWNGSKLDQYAFIPVRDESGNYPSYAPDSSDEITTEGVMLGVATGVGGALVFLGLLWLCRHCLAVEQQRRQQRKQLASKLKDMAEDPICKSDYNGDWIRHCAGCNQHHDV